MHHMEHPAPPMVHRSSARMSELPRTGAATDVALPLGLGLLGAGLAFMAAARRRLARVLG
jgi:LPXTG-motif cell wall-anchored protein